MMKLEGVMEKLKGLDPKTFVCSTACLRRLVRSSRQLTHRRVGCPACCSPLPNSPLPTGGPTAVPSVHHCRAPISFSLFFEAAVLNVRAILASWVSQPRLRTRTYSGTKD